MAKNKSYFFIKLQKDFFMEPANKMLIRGPDGKIRFYLLIQFYILSLDYGGYLMFDSDTPFTEDLLAATLEEDLSEVQKSISYFRRLHLLELRDGAMYLTHFDDMVSSTTLAADRKRASRENIARRALEAGITEPESEEFPVEDPEAGLGDLPSHTGDGHGASPSHTKSGHGDLPSPPELESELEVRDQNKNQMSEDREADTLPVPQLKEQKKPAANHQKKVLVLGEFKNVRLTEDEYNKLKMEYQGKADEYIIRLSRYMKSKGRSYKSHYATIQTWIRNDQPAKTGEYSAADYQTGKEDSL